MIQTNNWRNTNHADEAFLKVHRVKSLLLLEYLSPQTFNHLLARRAEPMHNIRLNKTVNGYLITKVNKTELATN